MDYIDLVCYIACGIHILSLFIDLIINFLHGKKLKSLCDKCGMPLYENVIHNCVVPSDLGHIIASRRDDGDYDLVVNSEQLNFLLSLVKEIK